MSTHPARVTATGIIEEWPPGLTRDLPGEDWLVVHAHPRQDKKLIGDLRAHRIPGCAFFERRVRHYPGKGNQVSIVPLLGGYIFVVAAEARKHEIYGTGRVVRIIDVRHPKSLVADLTSLCRLVAAVEAPLIVRPEIIQGRRITITRGVFAGCSGIVTKRQNQIELLVNLELLGHSVSTALPVDFADLVDESVNLRAEHHVDGRKPLA